MIDYGLKAYDGQISDIRVVYTMPRDSGLQGWNMVERLIITHRIKN